MNRFFMLYRFNQADFFVSDLHVLLVGESPQLIKKLIILGLILLSMLFAITIFKTYSKIIILFVRQWGGNHLGGLLYQDLPWNLFLLTGHSWKVKNFSERMTFLLHIRLHARQMLKNCSMNLNRKEKAPDSILSYVTYMF